ncbi:Cell death protease [Marasmius crinis-equi]|uniref:Carboxypeptidase n=1 Tax=Marasmius crinis-equi TaxID=585013 RepID=A0ABR3FPS5_9AGAR
MLLPLILGAQLLRNIPVLAQDLPTAASLWVPSLPDIHQDPLRPLNIHAGALPSDPNARNPKPEDVTPHIYFVMIKNRRVADKERVVFWFNGGPGCSSFDGLMMEVGPWRMDGKGGFQVAEGGWEEYTTMVYIDQPAGTGFSYTSSNNYVHSLPEASMQLLEFLRNFYRIFPEYERMDTYLAGESYAGQYIPYFADAILDSSLNVPLKGVAIGNGWIDARRQYPSYLEYSVKMGILEHDSEDYKAAKARTDECVESLKAVEGEPVNDEMCEGLLLDVTKVRQRKVDGNDMCINIYDVRYDDSWPACGMNWPPDIKPITTYLDRREVVSALHADAHAESWVECRGRIHSEMDGTKSNSSITLLPKILEKIPVLIFAGDQDLICNYVGLEAMIQDLTWNGGTGLGTVKMEQWRVNNTAAGTWVSSRNLTYAKIFNASHMAPFDVPHVTHDMILRFMGVDFSAIMEGSAKIPSSIGSETKPQFLPDALASITPIPAGKTPEQDKAMWEAYYNAGAVGVVLFLIVAAIGTFFWCRIRRRRTALHLPVNRDDEESIPLTSSRHDDSDGFSRRKGKEKAVDPPEEQEQPIFDVGDSDDEDEKQYKDRS